MIEIGACSNYTDFKEGDDGNYQQFSLFGCRICDTVYGGNRINKDDKSCYPECGFEAPIFDTSNSNKKCPFYRYKKRIYSGKKRLVIVVMM